MIHVSKASSIALVVGLCAAAAVEIGGCVPVATAPSQTPQTTGQQVANQVSFAPQPPEPPPANPQPDNMNSGNAYTDRFLELWVDIHKLSNGYFSPEGIPYHAVETLMVEAPDYGHETTSEAYSYWLWLEAMYGKVTGDWSHLTRAWANMEYYMIPKTVDQPTNKYYTPAKPATYAAEHDSPNEYPSALDGSVAVGKDPIADELKRTYNTPDVYLMHWLLDVDNFYGYGNHGDGTSRASFINTFQRGSQESVWETVTQPCWEEFKWGRPQDGFLSLFVAQPNPAKQWKYSSAPDAEARAIQATYWAKRWADEQGGSSEVDALLPKASMMGDMLRYTFFDKYFKSVPCTSPDCKGGQAYESSMWLINWYAAWGGSMPGGANFGWAWRIGASFNHQGYQNPVAAYALSGAFAPLTPRSTKGARDWAISLQRQLEFYRWLQSEEGGIAGGATNSWKGRYEAPPTNVATFYGLAYDVSPVFLDPPSNEWFGFQVWSMERLAEYYYITGDAKAKAVIDRWIKFAMANTTLKGGGDYSVPATMKWSGQPAAHWNELSGKDVKNWDNTAFVNKTLRVKVDNKGPDAGTAAGLAQTLAFYAARSGDDAARLLAKELLDRMWSRYRDDLGVTTPEARSDYQRFAEKVYVPPGWTGTMPSGALIDSNATFISIRPQYKQDPAWPKVEAYLNGGRAPKFTYHRFWAQAHVALAFATYGWLFPEDKG